MIKVGIIGATGYAGNELVRLLLGHKDAEIVWYGSRSYIDQKYADVYRNMFQLVDAVCMDDNMDELAKQVDVIFTATPQGLCASLVNEEILSNTKIVDLSADFRLKDVSIYEQWYKLEHKAPQYIDEAVYGLCEINRNQITEKTRIVANPGCYTTTSILTLYPMVKEGLIDPDTIIIDAKSGTSGAGRGAKVANLFCEVNESMKAYGVGTHRHTPEIEEQLGYACGRNDLKLIFTPHLVPMNRGILVTAYANLAKDVTYEEVKAVYDKYYANEKFVRVLEKDVRVARQALHAFLYAGSARVVQRDDRRAVLEGHRLNLDDLLRVRGAERAAQHREVVGVDENLAAVDLAVARHDAVARNAVALHAVVRAAVHDELVQFDERSLVEQRFDPLAGGHFARLVLFLHLVGSAAFFGGPVTPLEILVYPFVFHLLFVIGFPFLRRSRRDARAAARRPPCRPRERRSRGRCNRPSLSACSAFSSPRRRRPCRRPEAGRPRPRRCAPPCPAWGRTGRCPAGCRRAGGCAGTWPARRRC